MENEGAAQRAELNHRAQRDTAIFNFPFSILNSKGE